MIDTPMVISEPAEPAVSCLQQAAHAQQISHSCRFFFEYAKIEQAKERLSRQGAIF